MLAGQKLKGLKAKGASAPENILKGTSINCLRPLRDLKRVAARRNSPQMLVAFARIATQQIHASGHALRDLINVKWGPVF